MGTYRPADVLPARERHLVTRFSYGLTPTLAAEVRKAGGAQAWFERQLATPGRVADGSADRLRGWWPDLDRGPAELWQRQITEVRGGWEVMSDYGR